MDLHLPGLACRACARRAEGVLRRAPGVLGARVGALAARAEVRFDGRRTSAGALAAALGQAGYEVETGAAPIAEIAVDLGICLAALVSLLLLGRAAGEGDATVQAARLALSGVAVFVGGVPPLRRALGLARRGILGREAPAMVAALALFGVGIVAPALGHGAAPSWLAALGAGAAAWRGASVTAFEGAAAIAVAALAARVAEAAVHRAALGLGGGADLAVAASGREQPGEGSWDEAAAHGIFTAALACATFALVAHALVGRAPLSPRGLFACAAVLAGASPASILVAGPAARCAVLARARVAGAVAATAAALAALAGVDTLCLQSGVAPPAAVLEALRRRGLRVLGLGARAAEGLRGLQEAGAGVVVVGRGEDAAALAEADAAVVVGPGDVGAGAALVLPEGGIAALPALVDLGRALRAVTRQNAGLAAIYNAALIPAAALGVIPPFAAAALGLAETLAGLANAARILRSPRISRLGP